MLDSSPDDDLPICPKCGNVMQLIDLAPGFREVGIPVFEEELPFSIECCDLVLRMDDDEERRRAIKALKAFHHMGEVE